MTGDLYKFPSTPHLALMADKAARDDKVLKLEAREEFLQHELIVEEKVDGANLGISFDEGGELRDAEQRDVFAALIFRAVEKASRVAGTSTRQTIRQVVGQVYPLRRVVLR